MKNRHPALLAALMMLVSGASCASGDSSSKNLSSAAEPAVTTVSTTAAAPAGTSEKDTEKVTGKTTEKITDKAIEKVTEAPSDELPAMGTAYKELDCLDVEGIPDAIHSCGNIVALSCYTVGKDGQRSVKYYIIDAVNDKLLRTIDAENSREILLGTDAEGTLTAEIWKDWINETSDKQELVFYKPDGSRTAEEYTGDMMFLKYDPDQLYDLSKGIAKLGTGGSREIVFDSLEAEETQIFDASKNRAVVTYSAESFTEPTTLMLADTSTGKEISELKAENVVGVYFAGDYAVVSCIPDYDTYEQYTSVYEIGTGKLVWTFCEKEDERGRYGFYSNSCYGLNYENLQSSEPLTYNFLRVSDGAAGTLSTDIQDVFQAESTSVTSADRLISAIAVGDPQKDGTRVRLIMIDPAQVTFDGEIEKCDPYEYKEKDNKCGEKFSDLRAKADKIEEKYGVRMLIGDEVLDLDNTHDPYQFVSAEGEDADERSYKNTERALNTIDEMLGKYPEDFFEQFRINGKAGLCIALAQDIVDKYNDTSFEAGGVTYNYGLWSIIVMRPDGIEPTGTMLHHEMFHAVEFIVEKKSGEINEDEWAALNPEGFSYSTNFEGYDEGDAASKYVYSADNDPYFYREYSKVTPMEDRATLIEGLFTDAYSDSDDYMTYIEDIQNKCPHLKAKLDYLAEWTKQLFGYVYWEKMTNVGI